MSITILICQAGKWARSLFVVGGTQAFVQLLGFVVGLAVLRSLTPEQYGLYGLAYSALGASIVLSDGGIAAAMLSIGARDWQNPERIKVVYQEALRLRIRQSILGLAIALLLLLSFLVKQKTDVINSLAITLCTIPIFYASLSGQLLGTILSLRQQIGQIQSVQVLVAAARLLFFMAILAFAPYAWCALLLTALTQWGANLRLRRIANDVLEQNCPPDPEVGKAYKALIRRTLPGAFYYAFSGQINILLLSFFGTTEALAQVFAVGRIAMIVNIVQAVFDILIVPRFARLEISTLAVTRFVQVQILLAAATAVLLGGTRLFPNAIEWLGGSNYSGLQAEFSVAILGASLSLWAAICGKLLQARGWVLRPEIWIPTDLLVRIVVAANVDLSSAMGILLINVYPSAALLFSRWVYAFMRFRRD